MALAAASLLLASPAPVAAQSPEGCAPSGTGSLLVYGHGIEPRRFEAEELRASTWDSVMERGHDGVMHRYAGVRLDTLLIRAGVLDEGHPRGGRLLEYLVAEAADGYAVVLALPEVHPAYTERRVIVAHTVDGEALEAEAGPLQLVVEGDLRHGRWVRQLACVRVARAEGAE